MELGAGRWEIKRLKDERLRDQKTAESARQVAAATNGPRDEEPERRQREVKPRANEEVKEGKGWESGKVGSGLLAEFLWSRI